MNKLKNNILLLSVAAGMAVAACQRPTERKEKLAGIPLRTHKEAVDTLRLDQGAQTKPLQTEALADSQVQTLLQKYNLATFWQPDTENGEVAALYNGFYGEDHHRIEMYFASVERDQSRPGVYHVTGKSRFKKNITPFSGEIIIDSLTAFSDPNLNGEEIKEMGFTEVYAAAGRFILREDSSVAGSGVFQGKLALDFGVREDQKLHLWHYSPTEGQGTGFLFDGEWTSYKTGKSKPILWAKDIFMIADNILEDFSIGERDVEINPEYRHLGWDNFWENDEWYNAPAAL